MQLAMATRTSSSWWTSWHYSRGEEGLLRSWVVGWHCCVQLLLATQQGLLLLQCELALLQLGRRRPSSFLGGATRTSSSSWWMVSACVVKDFVVGWHCCVQLAMATQQGLLLLHGGRVGITAGEKKAFFVLVGTAVCSWRWQHNNKDFFFFSVDWLCSWGEEGLLRSWFVGTAVCSWQ